MERCSVEADLYSRLLASLHMKNITTVPVKHCPNSFGVALSHRDGWKVTYSGDTMPCDGLVELGMYIRPEGEQGKGNSLVHMWGLWRQCNKLCSVQFFFLASENFKPLFLEYL